MSRRSSLQPPQHFQTSRMGSQSLLSSQPNTPPGPKLENERRSSLNPRRSQPHILQHVMRAGAFHHSQPQLHLPRITPTQSPNSVRRNLPRIPPQTRPILRRSPQSDLAVRFQQRPYDSTNSDSSNGPPFSNESTPSRSEAPEVVDPVYLALKQATGKYGGQRRGSSNQFDSSTPSPRNLSQISLQDSGYAENVGGSRGQLLGSTPQLAPGPTQRPRAPKLNKQMKSLSLDCADAPPPVNTTMRSQFRNKAHLSNEWEQTSSAQQSPRSSDKQASHIVTHDYSMPDGSLLFIGDRMLIVDNGDPDWLHGFRINDRHQQLLTFPSTCVAAFQPDECPMKLIQNIHIPEAKLRFYRDQVVFGVPDPHNDLTRICVRNVRGAKAFCSIKYLRPL